MNSLCRDHNVRNNSWEEIAEQMNATSEECKDRWSKLRNCFTNALKRHKKKSGQAAMAVTPWKFEKQMEFLLPYLEGRRTITNLLPTDDDDSIMQTQQCNESEASTSTSVPDIRTPSPSFGIRTSSTIRSPTSVSSTGRTPSHNSKREDDNLLKDMVNVMKSSHELKQKRSLTEMDDTDYFFLSMSRQLKKLPKADQATIKFHLHKLVHDSEMNMLNRNEKILNTPINVTSNKKLQNINTQPNQTQMTNLGKYQIEPHSVPAQYGNENIFVTQERKINMKNTLNVTNDLNGGKTKEERFNPRKQIKYQIQSDSVLAQYGNGILFATQEGTAETHKEELPSINMTPNQKSKKQIITIKNPLIVTNNQKTKIKEERSNSLNQIKYQIQPDSMLAQYESENLFATQEGTAETQDEELPSINMTPNQKSKKQIITIKNPLIVTNNQKIKIKEEKSNPRNETKYQIQPDSMLAQYGSENSFAIKEGTLETQEEELSPINMAPNVKSMNQIINIKNPLIITNHHKRKIKEERSNRGNQNKYQIQPDSMLAQYGSENLFSSQEGTVETQEEELPSISMTPNNVSDSMLVQYESDDFFVEQEEVIEGEEEMETHIEGKENNYANLREYLNKFE